MTVPYPPPPVTPANPPKRPWFKKKRVLIPAALLVLIVIIESNTSPKPTPIPTDAQVAASVAASRSAAGLPTTTVAPTTPAPVVAPAPAPSGDALFTALIDQKSLGVPDSAMLDIGHKICNHLKQGGTVDVQVIALNGVAPSISFYDAGYVVAAAVAAFCPEEQPKVDSFVTTYGG